MCLLLADIKIYHSYDKDYAKQDKGGGTCASLVVCERVIDKADQWVESAGVADGTHRITEYTYYAGIFLESANKACDNYVCDHRRKQRNGDL